MEQCSSRSEYLRKLVRRDTEAKNQQLKDAQTTTWQTLVGQK